MTASSDSGLDRLPGRARLGWWLVVVALALVAGYVALSFVGLLVVGVFGYYATRPICRRLGDVIDADGIAAGVTVSLVLLPVGLVTLYTLLQVTQQVTGLLDGVASLPAFARHNLALDALPEQQRRSLLGVLQNPQQHLTNPGSLAQSVMQAGVATLSALVSSLLFVALAVTLSFYLLKNDDGIADAIRQLVGGRDTTAYAYASAVDADLEAVFYGNLLFVVAMTVVAAVTYWATNLLAPAGIRVPMVFALAFLTGVASLVPLVVGKLVYVPVVGSLAVQALGSGGDHLAFVGATLVAYVLLLDLLPQTFLQPYLSGRHVDMVLLLFGYILGPILFGWYGFFLLPIVFVVLFELVRIVLPELVRGERLTATVSLGDAGGGDRPATRASGTDADGPTIGPSQSSSGAASGPDEGSSDAQ